MDDVKQQVIGRLKQANNILVTVRNNPSVDLLAACIGLALALDKLDKHATAVFSGQVPSTIEFLKPEDTLEQNPDSLRDFIIALDKSKADKLRYKVEDKVVRIFITPYKTSLSEKDLEFSQGDFNVDAVVALGAHEQQELDQAITTHGRILHDATVISINNTPSGSLGSLNWQDISASSISEMITQLVMDLDGKMLDNQIATALLTGIVAETARFSNERTTPRTMNMAGELMAAGADQQLVATELQTTPQVPEPVRATDTPPLSVKNAAAAHPDDGTLDIDHEAEAESAAPELLRTPAPAAEPPEEMPKIQTRELLPPEPPHITGVRGAPGDTGAAAPFTEEYADGDMPPAERSYLVGEPTLPAVTPKAATPAPEPSQSNPGEVPASETAAPLLSRSPALGAALPPIAPLPLPEPPQVPSAVPAPAFTLPQPPAPQLPTPPLPPTPTPAATAPADENDETLEQIEAAVHSPHLGTKTEEREQPAEPTAAPSSAPAGGDLDTARSQVLQALQQGPQPLKPAISLNAMPLGGDLHPHTDTSAAGAQATPPPGIAAVKIDEEGNFHQVEPGSPDFAEHSSTMPLPPVPGVGKPAPDITLPGQLSNTPPPVPPPMMPPFRP